MGSIREFVSKKLEPSILRDAKKHLIFNETDLHVRTAHHIQNQFIVRQPGLYLLNEPSMRIGTGRGTISAKPDIVICDGSGPLAAFELKCHLDSADQKVASIAAGIQQDIDVLKKLGDRFEVEYVFAIVLLNITDPDIARDIDRYFASGREPWMKHHFRLHLINLRGRIRSYSEWADRWQEVRGLSSLQASGWV